MTAYLIALAVCLLLLVIIFFGLKGLLCLGDFLVQMLIDD